MMPYVILAAVAFATHLVWEQAHLGLYMGYGDLGGGVPVTLFATLGDVAYTLGAVLFISWARNDFLWFRRVGWRETGVLAVLGLFIALFVEYKALALGRWQYADAMPIMPWLGVGASPLLQMLLLVPVSVIVTSRISGFRE